MEERKKMAGKDFLRCLLFFFLLSIVSSSPTTLKIHANRSAFSFFSKSAKRIIDKEVPGVVLPNISIALEGPGSGTLYAFNLRVVKVASPQFTLAIDSSGFHWQSKGGGVRIEGLFTVEYALLFPIVESGSFRVVAADFGLAVSALATAFEGHPQFSITECNTDVHEFSLQIYGGVLEWLVNLFNNPLSEAIREQLNKQGCQLARNVLTTEANKFLHSLPTTISLGKNIFLTYFLQRDPIYTPSHVQMESSTHILFGNRSACSLPAYPLQEYDVMNPRMFSVWISEQIPNCLLQTAFDNLPSSLTITHENVPPLEKFLKTTCLLTCIGAFLPELSTRFPNSHLSLGLSLLTRPIVFLSSDNATIILSIAVEFYVFPKSDHPNSLAQLKIDASASIDPYIKGHILTGRIGNVTMNAKEVFSTIGQFSERFLKLLSEMLENVTIVLAKTIVDSGLPIPIFDNVTISNSSSIVLQEGQLLLSLDLIDESEIRTHTRKHFHPRLSHLQSS